MGNESKLVLAHGAGAPMDSDWMNTVSSLLEAQGIEVHRFNFPYMDKRSVDCKKRPPDKASTLIDCFKKTLRELDIENTYIGGKSMGGRIAATIADEVGAAGVICFGFPFHAPGREIKEDRLKVLREIETSTLILQGERDTMGSKDEIESYALSKAVRVEFLPDGDHSFKARVKSGHTLEGNLQTAANLTADFIK